MGPPRLAGTVVVIVLALASAEPQPFRQRRAPRPQFGVCVKRGLVLPQFEQDQLVGIEDALEHLELFAAGMRLLRQFEKIEAAVVWGCREPAIGKGNLIGAGVEEARRISGSITAWRRPATIGAWRMRTARSKAHTAI